MKIARVLGFIFWTSFAYLTGELLYRSIVLHQGVTQAPQLLLWAVPAANLVMLTRRARRIPKKGTS